MSAKIPSARHRSFKQPMPSSSATVLDERASASASGVMANRAIMSAKKFAIAFLEKSARPRFDQFADFVQWHFANDAPGSVRFDIQHGHVLVRNRRASFRQGFQMSFTDATHDAQNQVLAVRFD